MFVSSVTCAKYRGETLSRLPRPSLCGTYHVHANGERVHECVFDWVLPYHAPGLAPVGDETGAYHIDLNGNAAYSQRYSRTFGYYCGYAAVADSSGWHHIDAKGLRSYIGNWDWCGNFQQHRSTVRDKAGMYFHIRVDGTVLDGGPYAYAGDFREGAAVVRGLDGLCRHVDLDGQLVNEKEFIDLDNFHKGYARARDERGWFFVDRDGGERLPGKRYAEIEPFYNGQAHVRTHAGDRLILSEDGVSMAKPQRSVREMDAQLQHLAVDMWGPLAVRLGIRLGIHGGQPSFEVNDEIAEIVKSSWVHLGLLDRKGSLTPLGSAIQPDSVWEKRFLYWTGVQLKPWLTPEERLSPEGFIGGSFFSEISSEPSLVQLVHEVLDSYAQDDWAGIDAVLELEHDSTVVDLGGGKGGLLSAIGSNVRERILVDLPEVVELLHDENISGFPCDIFVDDLPIGDVYILSRVLHDWPNQVCKKLLSRIPKSSRLIVIDRVLNPEEHGLLNLNMLLVSGGKERNQMEWDALFRSSGWELGHQKQWSHHTIFFLKGD